MKRLVHALAWVALALAVFVLWPQQWGGSMTYLITTGDSMAPTWQAGDLAVLRAADDYGVGDVAAFRSAELDGTVVMHRVVEDDGGTLRFQGDSNDFVDPDVVTEDQVLGRLLVRIPSVGRFLTWFAEPVNLAITALALFLLVGDRDRRPERPTGVVKPSALAVTGVVVPPGAVVVDVAASADLEALAHAQGRPLLREQAIATTWLVDGPTLYRFREVPHVVDELDDRRRGNGRDSQYGEVPEMPRPRTEAAPSARRRTAV